MKKNVVFIILFGFILFFITVVDLTKEDKNFSESENRILAQKPQFTIKDFADRKFGKQYEEYMSDQFMYRDKWVLLKSFADIGFSKKELNGVYFVSPDTLLEKHNFKELEAKADEKLKELKELSKWCDGNYFLSIMLVPTADAVYQEKLPKYAPFFDQNEFLKEAENVVGSTHFVKAGKKLEEHKEEYIYYRTDHHWTTLGAFYGYEAWAERIGVESYVLEEFTRETVSEDFLGTLHSKINIPVESDSMELFFPKRKQQYKIYYDFNENPEKLLYNRNFLNKKDKYSIYLNGNHAFIEINTQNQNGKSVMVIKDSYANCFIPFLINHYETVYVVDFRYYRGNLKDLLEVYGTDDILVLYNVVHFIKEFRY